MASDVGTRAARNPNAGGRVGSGSAGSDRYKWIALSNVTLGVLLATLDGSITLIAMPDIFRGIHLDPLVPANSFYLLWMILGYLVVTSVLIVSLGRLGDMFGRVQHVQPRLRHLHGRLAGADDRLDDRPRGGDVPDRLPHRAGHRRRVPARELGGDPHRRLSRQPARHGARHQQHRRRQRDVRRARARWPARPDRLAARVPDLGAGRAVRNRVGLPEARGAQHAAARARRLVGQHHVRARADPDHGVGHLWHPPVRRPRARAGAARACSPCSARASLPGRRSR